MILGDELGIICDPTIGQTFQEKKPLRSFRAAAASKGRWIPKKEPSTNLKRDTVSLSELSLGQHHVVLIKGNQTILLPIQRILENFNLKFHGWEKLLGLLDPEHQYLECALEEMLECFYERFANYLKGLLNEHQHGNWGINLKVYPLKYTLTEN